jgi:hypothetical protein
MIKQKEKFKGLLVEKMLVISRTIETGKESISLGQVEDTGDERYLY